MAGRPKGAENKDKPYREALRLELAAAGEDLKELRAIARVHIGMCKCGDLGAITALADRTDGKPAQESTVTIDDKRDAADWTRAELVAFLNDARASRERIAQANGRDPESDSVH